jgi:phytoene dehydrogenase-like protein
MAAPPIHPEERRRLLEKSPEGRRLLEVSALSPFEFVQKEFESPVVQAGLIFFNGLREVDMRVRGFGHHIAMLLASPAKAQMVRGGSQRLGEAIAGAVREAGGDILLNTPLGRILVEDGRAVGIETAEGDVIRADRFVASSLNPRQTFLELIEPDHLPRAWREKAFGFEFNMVAPLATVHLGLSEPPRYAAAERVPSVEDAFMVIMGIDDLTTFERMFERHETGNLPPGPILYGACPTRFDPTQAPDGKHTAFMWQKVPYRLYGDPDNWDRHIGTVGRDMLAQWTRYAPNLADAVDYSFFNSPRDIVRSLPNLGEGDPLGGAYSNGQYLYNRPFEGAGQYRTCLDGLYLCGASTHPGGNITGFPGFNAAGVIAADLGLGVDWVPPSLSSRLEGLAARAAE